MRLYSRLFSRGALERERLYGFMAAASAKEFLALALEVPHALGAAFRYSDGMAKQ
jgi:hypothetical protein